MNKKLIESLAKLAKVSDVEKFTEALQSEKDESNDFDFSNLVVRTAEEENTFKETLKDNLMEANKSKIFKDAFEIQIKNFKKDLELDFEGKKPEDFLDAYKNKVLSEAKIEPEKKIQEMEQSMENLRSKVTDWEGKYTSLQSEVKSKERDLTIQSLIPEIPETIGLSKAEASLMYKLGREFKEDGIYLNGNKLVDSMEKPVDMQADVKDWFESKGWAKAPEGRGGGAAGGTGGVSTPKTEEEFHQYLKQKGINLGSAEANALLSKFAEETPELLEI